MMYEFQRLTEMGLFTKLESYFNQNGSRIQAIQQGKTDAGGCNAEGLDDVPVPEKSAAAALFLLPSLLGDEGKCFLTKQDSQVASPSLVKDSNTEEFNLIVENIHICRTESQFEGVCALFSAFYIFNCSYTPTIKKSGVQLSLDASWNV